MEPKKNKIQLIQIDRTSAWILLISILAYMLSGYGMTKGIFNSQTARFMHRNILPTITMIAFVGHTSLAVRTAMMRKRIWNKFTKIILILAYTIGFLFFIYLEVFIMRDSAPATTKTTTTQSVETPKPAQVSNIPEPDINTQVSEDGEQQKTFTLEELSKYDGKNGNPPYVAVDGLVYDMTDVFEGGRHYEHFAGEELTDAFYTKHAKKEIAKYPVVGILEE